MSGDGRTGGAEEGPNTGGNVEPGDGAGTGERAGTDDGRDGDPGSGATLWAYLFVLAPVLVVVAVGPALALAPAPLSVSLGPARFAGLVPVGAGLGLVAWAVDAFARAGETPSPADLPDRLVTGGPLAYTRNPIYLGTVLAAAGEALILESAVVAGYAALLWVAYHLLTVYYEEPKLRGALGEDYEDYCERVPRWL